MEKKSVIQKLTYLSIVICLLAFMIFAVSLKVAEAQNEPQYGGILKICDIDESPNLGYPPKMFRTPWQRQVAPAIETLFRLDKTGKPVPWLATDFKSNVAAKTITLTLRKGVKFHDGTDFNAEAVKWNLGQSKIEGQMGISRFKSIDVIDDYTIRVNFSDWDSTITSNLAMYIGMMISPTAYKKNGQEWCIAHPVGTGPFKFVSWEKGSRVTYKKFEGYWQKGKPYLDGIQFIPIANEVTREISLRAGNIDLIITQISKGIQGFKKQGFAVSTGRLGAGVRSFVYDSANPKSPFSDIRVRRAVQYAINSKEIVDTIFHGYSEPSNQSTYKGYWGYNPSVVGYPYNPTKAKELLAEAGYPNGFKTKLTYLDFSGGGVTSIAVQGFLKDIGIAAELYPMKPGSYNKAVFGGKWEGIISSSFGGHPDITSVLASRYSGGGKWFSQWFVPDEYIKTIKNAISAPDFETKQKYVQESMKLSTDKYALQISLFPITDFFVYNASFQNHGLGETPYGSCWRPEDVWLKR